MFAWGREGCGGDCTILQDNQASHPQSWAGIQGSQGRASFPSSPSSGKLTDPQTCPFLFLFSSCFSLPPEMVSPLPSLPIKFLSSPRVHTLPPSEGGPRGCGGDAGPSVHSRVVKAPPTRGAPADSRAGRSGATGNPHEAKGLVSLCSVSCSKGNYFHSDNWLIRECLQPRALSARQTSTRHKAEFPSPQPCSSQSDYNVLEA